MNIQINCKDNVTEQDLRYIYYNLPDIIKEYERGLFNGERAGKER